MISYPLFDVWCDKCGTKWLVPSSTQDGDLHVFHRKNLAKHVALNVYADDFFDQVISLIEEICGANSARSGAVSNTHSVISEVADRDEAGGKFDILANLCCPVCGASALAYRPTDPPQSFTEELPPLRHEHWSALGKPERLAEIKKALGK